MTDYDYYTHPGVGVDVEGEIVDGLWIYAGKGEELVAAKFVPGWAPCPLDAIPDPGSGLGVPFLDVIW